VTLPKSTQRLHNIGEHIQAYQSSLALKLECDKWLSIVSGAECARIVLEKLFAKGGSLLLEKVVQSLTSHKSSIRPPELEAMTPEKAAAALLLLRQRTAGGLSLETVKKSARESRLCFQPFAAGSSEMAQKELQKDMARLRTRQRHLGLETQRAFMAMMPGDSADCIYEGDGEGRLLELPIRNP
jgi:hypothetical protein